MKNKLNALPQLIANKLAIFAKYKVLLFVILVGLVYGYTMLSISSLTNAQPTADEINAQSDPVRSARIDMKVVRQLQQLQDNSVNVKALFDEARDNPFQE